MNFVTLFKIFKRPYAKYLIALIVLTALLLISLMSCKTRQATVDANQTNIHETHGSASLRLADMTTVIDERFAVINETVWRPPDSLGRLYPLITLNANTQATRKTNNNITSTRTDTLYITDSTNTNISSEQTSIREPSQRLTNRSSLINTSLIVTSLIFIAIAAIALIVLLRR